MRALVRMVAVVVFAVLGLLVLALLVVTNTDWGRERVRRLALDALRPAVHGIVRVGRLDGNLLSGLILTDLSITDSAGAPFLSVERVRVQYDLGALLSKRIVLTSLALERPVIVLDQPPGGRWNYERIFPPSPHADTTRGFGSWITLNDVRVTDGWIVVRTPWEVPDSLPHAVRDSMVRVALAGGTRAMVVRASGGYQTVMDFRSIHAALPHIRLADPDSSSRLFRIGALRMTAYPFRPPSLELRDLRGDLHLDTDSLWFRGLVVALPGTALRASGSYLLSPGDLRFAALADTLALADFRWLYPRLPASGTGAMRADITFHRRGESVFRVRDARLTVGTARVAGRIGLTLGAGGAAGGGVGTSGFRIHDTDLTFSGVGTRLIEQLVPGLRIPRRGTLAGRAVLAGTMQDLRVDATVAFDDARGGTSRVALDGRLGQGEGGEGGRGELHATDLRIRLEPLQAELVRVVRPSLPVGGTVRGEIVLDGSSAGRLEARSRLVHRDRRALSRVETRATLVALGRRGVDAEVRFEPLALDMVGRFAPQLALHGSAAGAVQAVGTMRSLHLRGALRLPDGGVLDVRGWGDLASAVRRYDVATQLRLFNVRAVTARGPATSLTAAARIRGRGLDPETMRAVLAADVSHSSVDSIPFDSLHLRVAVAGGVATVDSFSLGAPIGHVSVDGTFGIARGRSGVLTYVVEVDSLAGLRRLLPPADTGVVRPRAGRMAATLARARADSARLAERRAVERAATGRAPPLPRIDTVRALRRDSVSGALYTAGMVRGGVSAFDVRGRLALRALVARGNVVHRGRIEYAWRAARTPANTIVVGALLDSVGAAGFALDSVDLRATYRKPGGRVELAIYQDSGTSYHVRTEYALRLDRNELHILDLALRFGPRRWAAVRPARIQWGKQGLEVDSLELRSGERGRILVDADLPTAGPIDATVRVAGLEVSDVVGLLQGDLAATGELVLEARIGGTRSDPAIRGAAALGNATFRGAGLPELRTAFAYEDTVLSVHARVERADAEPLARLDATVPVNLAFAGAPGAPRLLERPMRIDFRADSLPLDVVPKLTDVVADVRGDVFGVVAARGTPRHPSLAGRLAVRFASFRVVPLGVTLRQIAGAVHMMGDSLAIDSLRGSSGGGTIAVAGGLGLATSGRPRVDLHLTGRDALVMDTERGRLRAGADITVRGPFDSVAVSGRAQISSGAVYLPEESTRQLVSLSDSIVPAVVDTSVEAIRALLPRPSPLTENMRVDVALSIGRDTWVRSSEANVEIYTTDPLDIHLDPATHALTAQGVVSTDRGDYTYLGRQFVLSHGTVTFTGDPQLDPLLQLSAVRQVELANQGVLRIQILIGGTLLRPTITLGSDAQPPISQSDLLSYLAFGQSTSSLLQLGGSSGLTGASTSSGQLVGNVAGIATRQLAAVALDVLAKQAQADLARSVGADVLNITPADIPSDFTPSSVETILAGTQVEAGKYVSERTFVAFQARPTLVAPGLRVEHRLPKGYRIEASLEPRFLVRQPTLSETPIPKPTSVLGAFLVREWRF